AVDGGVFFFRAEDGIRDFHVTGVQTCALPILAAYMVEQQDRLGLSAITVFGAQGQELVHVKDPILGDLATREVNETQLRQGAAGQELTTVRELSSGDLVEAVVPIWATRGGERSVVGVVVVGTHVTERLEARVRAR